MDEITLNLLGFDVKGTVTWVFESGTYSCQVMHSSLGVHAYLHISGFTLIDRYGWESPRAAADAINQAAWKHTQASKLVDRSIEKLFGGGQ